MGIFFAATQIFAVDGAADPGTFLRAFLLLTTHPDGDLSLFLEEDCACKEECTDPGCFA